MYWTLVIYIDNCNPLDRRRNPFICLFFFRPHYSRFNQIQPWKPISLKRSYIFCICFRLKRKYIYHCVIWGRYFNCNSLIGTRKNKRGWCIFIKVKWWGDWKQSPKVMARIKANFLIVNLSLQFSTRWIILRKWIK